MESIIIKLMEGQKLKHAIHTKAEESELLNHLWSSNEFKIAVYDHIRHKGFIEFDAESKTWSLPDTTVKERREIKKRKKLNDIAFKIEQVVFNSNGKSTIAKTCKSLRIAPSTLKEAIVFCKGLELNKTKITIKPYDPETIEEKECEF